MICPKCGTMNGDEFKFCHECGCALPKPADVQPIADNDNTSDDEISFDSLQEVQPVYKDSVNNRYNYCTTDDESHTEPIFRSDDIDEQDNDCDDDEIDFGFDYKPGKTKKRRENIVLADDDEPTDIKEKPMGRGEKRTKPRQEGHGAGSAMFIVTVVVLIALIAVLLITYVKHEYNGSFSMFFSSIFGSGEVSAHGTITEDVTNDGEPALLITVYAKKGCIVRFEEGATQQEATITRTSVAFRVPQSLWIPTEPVQGGRVQVVPTVFVIDPSAGNDIIQVAFEPIYISVPTVDVIIETPETKEFLTSSPTVEIAGRVSDVTAAVFIGETQLQIDETGHFRGVYHLDSLGTTTVIVEARKDGCEVGRATIIITYSKTDINITIANESMRTFEETIQVKGTIDKGASLAVSGIELEGDVQCNADTGDFSFSAKLPNVGLYTPTLTLTSGAVTSSVDIYIERAPDLNQYVEDAWAFDYKYIKEHPTMNKHYGITGTITEVYQTEPYVIAKLHTSDGDIVFTYYHTTQVAANDGKNYRIYAYLDGTDVETGLPRMYCWFIYKS